MKVAEIPALEVDPITLDIIENALRHARFEMDAVLFRSAMSPVIREQHDEFPMITDPQGRMVVGQFGAYINEMMRDWDRGIYPGDVILTSDPYKCSASISHTNDWLVLVPIFYADELVGWSSQFGHQMDAGGRLPGSLPTGATTVFEEGIIIPPLKIVERGEVAEDVLRLILNNVRLPEMNRADLFAIVAACHAGERRVIELCERFGKDVYLATLQALLDRTHEAMRKLIQLAIPEEPQTFEDYIDDDGLGNGPYKMKLTIWREGDEAWFDWSGTDPQSLGPINFYLSEGMFKMFIGVYLIMVNDPDILFNDGFYPLLHVVMPEGCLLNPRYPAALGCRTHGLTRLFDVLGGALTKQAPELNTAAGYGTSPYMLYSGWKDDGEFFYAMEILYGGIPGRPIGDGMDGHSWWPLFENIPTEYLEAYYPLRIDGYTTITDSGGAGYHRGGNGVEKRYVYLEPGHVSIHDDRWLTRPWGVLGGEPGQRSTKILRRADGTEQVLPAKCDEIAVEPGDMLIYRTAGGGGWKDRLERPVEWVERDVASGLVSKEKALSAYGVVLGDASATDAERARQRSERGDALAFDFGPSLEDTLAACEAETGLPAPAPAKPLRWSPLETRESALARARDA
jgi:N-methylhydantoinase B